MDNALRFIEIKKNVEGKMAKAIMYEKKKERERELKRVYLLCMQILRRGASNASLLIYSVHASANCFLADMRLYRALIEYQTMASALVSVSVLRAVGSRR